MFKKSPPLKKEVCE